MKSKFPFSGRLETCLFPEIAAAIYRLGKSGELTLSTPTGDRRVYFLDGNPVAVTSGDPADRLVNFLLKSGKIGPDEAKRLEKVSETRQALQTVDFVPEEVLSWGIKYRFVELCYDLFLWTKGGYRFQERPAPADLILLKVQTPILILKGASYLPERILRTRVPRRAVLKTGNLSLEEASFLRTEDAKFLTQALKLKKVDEILKTRPGEEDRCRRLLYSFSILELVSISPPIPGVAEPEEPTKAATQKHTPKPSAEPIPPPKEVQKKPPVMASPAESPSHPSSPPPKQPSPPLQERLPYRGKGQSVRPPRRRVFLPLQRRLVTLVGIGLGIILVVGLWKFVSVTTSPIIPAELTSLSGEVPAPQQEMIPPPVGIPIPSPTVSAGDPYEEGLALYRAGDLGGAAVRWLAMLRERFADAFTVQVEIACQPRTVEEDFQKWGQGKKLFITPINYQGRDCYQVFIGLFSSRLEAAEALENLPVEIRVQGAAVRAVETLL